MDKGGGLAVTDMKEFKLVLCSFKNNFASLSGSGVFF